MILGFCISHMQITNLDFFFQNSVILMTFLISPLAFFNFTVVSRYVGFLERHKKARYIRTDLYNRKYCEKTKKYNFKLNVSHSAQKVNLCAHHLTYMLK